MNAIEKAIEYFENVNQDCESCTYNNDSHNTDGSECWISCNTSLAIQALQEKQERDNMRCENCRYYTNCEGGLCYRADMYEYPNFNKEDFCSYFEKKKD